MYQSTLDGSPFDSGGKSGVGRKTLNISAPGIETFQTNFFTWYAGRALGTINLVRSRGGLEFDIAPAARRVEITGPEMRNLGACSHELIALSIGEYKVRVAFARFDVHRTVEIRRNETNRIVLKPSIAALNLSSEPGIAEFQLESLKPEGIIVKDSTPATISELPTGEYELTIWRGEYRKKLPVTVSAASATNELKIEFGYAKLAVSSEPTDATIRDGEKVLGRTPTILTLQPGNYRLQVTKEGFFGTNVSLTVSKKDSRSLSVTLVNVTYATAVERALHELSAFDPDYNRALAEVQKALQIKPADETALKLKRTIEFHRHLRNAKQFERDRDYSRALAEVDAALKLNADHKEALALKSSLERAKHEAEHAAAEARRKHPEKVFEEVTARLQHNQLFQPQLMRFSNSLDTVSAGVVRALGRSPEWGVSPVTKPDADTAIIHAAIKSFGGRKNVALVAGQTTDNEVTLHFKLFEFTLDTKIEITLGGVSEDSYRPLHPQHVSAVRAPFVEKQRAVSIQEFKKRIEDELR